MNSKPVYIIVALDKNNGIGKDGDIPWKLKGDMKFFKEITSKTEDESKQNMLIMGRKTWESIPERFRPLPERVNVVLTRNSDADFEGAHKADSLERALELANDQVEKIFIIGGGNIYQQALSQLDLDGLFITRIDAEYDCDTYFPEFTEKYEKETSMGEMEENGVEYEFYLYEK